MIYSKPPDEPGERNRTVRPNYSNKDSCGLIPSLRAKQSEPGRGTCSALFVTSEMSSARRRHYIQASGDSVVGDTPVLPWASLTINEYQLAQAMWPIMASLPKKLSKLGRGWSIQRRIRKTVSIILFIECFAIVASTVPGSGEIAISPSLMELTSWHYFSILALLFFNKILFYNLILFLFWIAWEGTTIILGLGPWEFYCGPILSTFKLNNWLGFYFSAHIFSKKLLVVLGWVCGKERIWGITHSRWNFLLCWSLFLGRVVLKVQHPYPTVQQVVEAFRQQMWQVYAVLRVGVPLVL